MSSTTNLLTLRDAQTMEWLFRPQISILEGFLFPSPTDKKRQTFELGCSVVISVYLIEQKMYHYYMVFLVFHSQRVVMTITV